MLSLGVLAELWLEFPEFEVVGLTVLARVLLEMYPLFHSGLVSSCGIYQTGPGLFMLAVLNNVLIVSRINIVLVR